MASSSFRHNIHLLRLASRCLRLAGDFWSGGPCLRASRANIGPLSQPDRKLCTSFSDFHAGSWNPAWSVATILTGLLSFMVSDEMTTGGMRSSDADKKRFAAESHAWNLKNQKFRTIFPEYAGAEMKTLPNMGESDVGKPDGPPLPKNLGNPDGSTNAADGLADSLSSSSIQGSYGCHALPLRNKQLMTFPQDSS